jgi:hypothetical protein
MTDKWPDLDNFVRYTKEQGKGEVRYFVEPDSKPGRYSIFIAVSAGPMFKSAPAALVYRYFGRDHSLDWG